MQAIGFYISYSILWLITLMPFWFYYRLSDFIYFLLYYVFSYRKKVVFKNIIKRKMRLSVCGLSSFGSDIAVKEYLYRLRSSDIFISSVKDVKIVTHDVTKFDGKDLPCYEIDCVFAAQE